MRLWIRNGRLIDPANKLDAVQDLWIADDRIIAIGSAPAGFEAERSIDAGGLVALNKLIAKCAKTNTKIFISELQFQPLKTLARANVKPIENVSSFYPSLKEALDAAPQPK